MTWDIVFEEAAKDDLKRLDHSQQTLVLKGIRKTALNPLPDTEGGYGKPLGNHNSSRLAGLMKIKFKNAGLRVVYRLKRENGIMSIVVVSIRDDEAVYKIAEKRIR